MKKIRGFSLLELLIVVFIIGVIAAIAFPTYTAHRKNYLFMSAKQELKQSLDMALSHANSLSKPVRIQFNTDDKNQLESVALFYGVTEDLKKRFEMIQFESPIAYTMQPDVRAIVFSNSQPISYYDRANTTVFSTQDCVITLMKSNDNQQTASIRVYYHTGVSTFDE